MDWEMWKSMQHSMALEGFEISDEKLKSLALKFEQEGYESFSDRILALVSEKGLPMSEAVKTVMSEFRERLR